MMKPWSPHEVKRLKAMHATYTTWEIAEALGRPYAAVQSYAAYLRKSGHDLPSKKPGPRPKDYPRQKVVVRSPQQSRRPVRTVAPIRVDRHPGSCQLHGDYLDGPMGCPSCRAGRGRGGGWKDAMAVRT